MQRFGMTIRLRPGSEEAYKNYHRQAWPEVLATLSACHVRNYSIYLRNDVLFSYFEYDGMEFQADMDRMAADPKTQEWWAVVKPLQEPYPEIKDGEWWAAMEEVFHLD